MMRFVLGAGAAVLVLAAAAGAFGGTAPAPHPSAHPSASPSTTPSATPAPSTIGTPLPFGVADLSADQIMINAEKKTRSHPKPTYITYQMHEVFLHHFQREEDDYRVWYRAFDGKGLMQNMNKDHFGRADTYFGYPFPSSPDNDILLYASPDPPLQPLAPTATPRPLASGATAPPVISTQSVVGDRYYSVKLAGVEDYNGKPVYHLTLRALRDERAHPWKDLWVDATTFDVWKGHAHASGTKGLAAGSLDAMVEFAQVGPYWLLAHAIGDGELHVGPLGDSGHYEYTFSNFGFPPSVPDWYFDSKQFKQHH